MAERSVFTVRRGSTHRVLLATAVGDTFTATCEADIRRLPGGRNSYSPDDAVALSYTDTPFAGDSDYGPGFYLTLTADDTADLEKGIYMVDARIEYSAPSTDTLVTSSWLIEVVEVATQP